MTFGTFLFCIIAIGICFWLGLSYVLPRTVLDLIDIFKSGLIKEDFDE